MNVRPVALDLDAGYSYLDDVDRPETRLGEETPGEDVSRTVLDALWVSLCRFDSGALLLALPSLQRALEQDQAALSHRAEITILLAGGYIWRDDPDRALLAAQKLLTNGQGRRFLPVLRTVMRYCYWRTRQFNAFYELSRPRSTHTHAYTALTEVLNLSIEAAAEAEQLRYTLAERLVKDALALATLAKGVDANAKLLAISVQAGLAYEIGALDEADLMLRGKLTCIEQYGSIDCAMLGFAVAAKIARAQGNPRLSTTLLSRGMQLGLDRGWPRLLACCAADQITSYLAQGDVHAAQALLVRAESGVISLNKTTRIHALDIAPLDIARQRIALARSEHASAIRCLHRMRELAQEWNHPAMVMHLTMVLAGALHHAGRMDEARNELLDALRAGADAGAFRTFLDEMPLIEGCLRDARSTLAGHLCHLNPYIGSLLAANQGAPELRRTSSRPAARNLLSVKETIILRLISVGLSNKNIARELQIAPETVKSHAKHIFIKLSAKTRAEAVARASEFGLI